MKLLFDQNLSFKLVDRLADLYPGSQQVHRLGLDQADDRVIWEHAKQNGFLLVSQDSDFAALAAVLGSPPKIVWLRCGKQPTDVIEKMLRRHGRDIEAFARNTAVDCLELL